MKKAEEEVKSVVKKKGFVDEEDLPRLQHLKAVVKETMRFQPMAEIISRETTEKCIINDKTLNSYHLVPGEEFVLIALPTVELALANLLYNFNWEMPTEDLDFDVVPCLTQHKKNAVTLMAAKFI
ncbi:hypothetical protein WN943_016645 [Citrus x changshan-huyou]